MRISLATIPALCIVMLCGCRPSADPEYEAYDPAPQETAAQPPKPPPPPVPPPAQAMKTKEEVQLYHVDIDNIRFDIAEDLNRDIKRKQAEASKPTQ